MGGTVRPGGSEADLMRSMNPLQGTNPAVVHSDVTSNNVLLIEDGSACIADFGLAQDVPRGDKVRPMPEVSQPCFMYTRIIIL